jgi:hypothetical protein
MKVCTCFTILLSILLIFIACQKDKNNPAAPTIVATEVWGYIIDNDSTNHGDATFEKKSDGNITESANWFFGFQNTIVECPFEGGKVTVADTVLSISAQGTATNPAAPTGYQNSAFTINISGSAHNGQSSGVWSIAFSTLGWPSTLQGTFSATRKSGSGITK